MTGGHAENVGRISLNHNPLPVRELRLPRKPGSCDQDSSSDGWPNKLGKLAKSWSARNIR
jgi:hypothetical protein